MWPSKYAKIRFRPGTLTTLPRTLYRLERGHPHHTPTPFGTHLRRSPCVPLRIPVRSTPMNIGSRFQNMDTLMDTFPVHNVSYERIISDKSPRYSCANCAVLPLLARWQHFSATTSRPVTRYYWDTNSACLSTRCGFAATVFAARQVFISHSWNGDVELDRNTPLFSPLEVRPLKSSWAWRSAERCKKLSSGVWGGAQPKSFWCILAFKSYISRLPYRPGCFKYSYSWWWWIWWWWRGMAYLYREYLLWKKNRLYKAGMLRSRGQRDLETTFWSRSRSHMTLF